MKYQIEILSISILIFFNSQVELRLTFFILLQIVILTSFSALAVGTGDERAMVRLDSCVAKAEFYLDRNLDSTLYFVDKIEETLKENNLEGSVSNFITLGAVYSATGDKEKGLEYFIRAKKLNDEDLREDASIPSRIFQSASIFVGIGNLYFSLNKKGKSLANYEAALIELVKLDDEIFEEELASQKVGIYNNIASIYIQNGDYDSALTYFQNARKLNETVKSKHYESSLTNNIGICYLEKCQFDLADHYLLKSLSVRRELGDKRGEALALNNLAKIQSLKGNIDKSREIYEEALSLARTIGNIHSTIISLESLASLYDTLGKYQQAFNTHLEFKTLSDSIFNRETAASMAVMEQDYLKSREQEISNLEKEKDQAEILRTKTRTLATLATLFFLLLTAILIIFLLRGKMTRSKLKHEKLRLESQNHSLERKTLEEALDFKERELTANALFLLKNNELIANIIDKLLGAKLTFKYENQKIIQDIIIELRASHNQNIWEEFETHFIQVHSGFYQHLQEKFPKLTSNELKLSAFLRLNMSTKEISAITHQTVNSITVARSRLRKKLEIDGEDTHLINFLMKI